MHADQLPWPRRRVAALAIGATVAALAVPTAGGNAAASIRTAAPTRMPAGTQQAASIRTAASVRTGAAARTAAGPRAAASARTAGRAGPGLKQLHYRGYRFEVPRGWPVINLAGRPRTCVRFDRHVVYLGKSGLNQDCPSWLIGTTEAVQIAPARRRSARSSVQNPVARQITVSAARIRVTATFDTDPTQVYRILASASLPAPIIVVPNPDPNPPQSGPGANPRALSAAGSPRFPDVNPPELPANVANFRGRGFDACTAPSRPYMRAWRRHSRYRAIGIYIGGADRACGQRNLSARWIRAEAAAGWRFFPMYVGPQASFNQLRSPRRQARRAARDAVVRAQRLGLGPRTPLYYDMEAYPPRRTGKVLRFFTAWTKRLHKLGYKAGVYSSSGSGIVDLARHYRSHRYKMPDVIYDALWNGSRNTKDRFLRKGQWGGHRRLHQYSGNVTRRFGGATINIDQDYLNVRLPTPGGTRQASRAAAQPDGTVDAFYRGADRRLWHEGPVSGAGAGADAAAPADLGGTLAAQPTVVSPVPGALDVFFEGPGHLLWEAARRAGRRWSAPRKISRMGVLGSAPVAVAQPNGVVDVFWRGSADDHLWHGQFSPGKGWKGPQDLRGSLASGPSPAESSPGTVQVFWKGRNRALWQVIRRPGRNWTRPSSLGMGPLGGAPHASARRGGAIDVFWRGFGNDRLWSATHSPGRRWSGPRDRGGHLASAPFPLMSAGGRVHVFWKGTDGRLWQVSRGPRLGWRHPFSLRIGPVRGGPFGIIGRAGKSELFWRGKAGHLWFAAQQRGGGWSRPRDLGGHVG
jgi:hypothetical protein